MDLLSCVFASVSLTTSFFDEKSKVDPNHPQMVWYEFGGVFRVFWAYFGCFQAPLIVKNAYSGHFEGPISRDLGVF